MTSNVFGTVKNVFMADCIEILSTYNIKFAYLYATKSDYGKPVIHASAELPKDVLQQLRNCWSVR